MRFYIGTDTRTSSEGLYLGSLEITSGKILLIDNIATLNHPSFVSIHPSGNYLYAVSENDNQVYSYMITPTSDDLVLLDKKPTNGSLPCYISTTANGQLLFIANYMGENCITLQLKKGGLMEISDEIFHEGTGKDPDRQEASHPHSIVPDPLSRFVYVADLGIDKIMIYEIDYKEGKLNPAKIPYQEVRSGSGPRHFVFYNNSGYAYVVNELNSTITAFIVDHELGRLSEIQTISTIPNNFSGTNSAADIHIRGGFLYASNRGHNSIAIFKIDQKSGKLQPVKCESVQGETPRNFAIDPTGKFVLVANQDTNNITCFKINSTTGELEYTGFQLEVPLPQCIKFIT